jgi:uncharacterized damage-inducible protein DinB
MEITAAKAANEELKFPLGKFDRDQEITPASRREFIRTIRELPAKMRAAVADLTEEQLETPYRPEGWTVRQTVHHVADSHLNSMIRFKLALTEDAPTIRPYEEAAWAELSDSRLPVEVSLRLLEALHERWAALLEAMSEEDWQRKLIHPDSGEWTLERMLGLYDWHSRHHTAHVTSLREREGW